MKAKEYDMNDFLTRAVNNLEVHKTGDNQELAFNISNNYEGRTFVKMLRKALNNDKYTMRVRGSQSDRLSYRQEGISLSDQSVPLKYANRLRIYLEEKESPKLSYYEAQNTHFEAVIESLRARLAAANRQVSNLIIEKDDLKKKLKDTEYSGFDEEQITIIKQFEEHKFLYSLRDFHFRDNIGKISVVKHAYRAFGLSLRDAKLICDALVFPEKYKNVD